ncbi:MAG: protein phosphatase 2C domain-containing protein [Myxococcales bacterium]|nr:protein phosphatase 2C domain-containing protein [Myxococcales bacterium]MBK7192665.1 protein phosphatase 2C domain-containing protein [Myxococcales bacterium]
MSGELEPPQEAAPPAPIPTLAKACVRGAKHVREDRPGQDAIAAAAAEGLVALAVADGHGSSERADVGAALAVQVAIDHLLRFGKEVHDVSELRRVHAFASHPLRLHLVRDWIDRVHQHAGDDAIDLQVYGSTLLFALATPTFLLLGQLGDGDMMVAGAGGELARPIAADPAHFAEETSSLCQPEAWAKLQVRVLPTPRRETLLLLSTDGYSKSYASDAVFEQIAPDYLEMMRTGQPADVERQLPEILDAVSAGGSGDDIAFGMLYWPASKGGGAPCASS